MLEVYLINGSRGEFQDDYEAKLAKHIKELNNFNELNNFFFKCSMNERTLPIKKKVKSILLELGSKSQEDNIRICFIHKNDVEDFLGMEELNPFRNDHFVYFTTQNRSRYRDQVGWARIDIMLSDLIEELKNSGKYFDVEKIITKLFNN
jgi:hypothetical protein